MSKPETVEKSQRSRLTNAVLGSMPREMRQPFRGTTGLWDRTAVLRYAQGLTDEELLAMRNIGKIGVAWIRAQAAE